MKRVWLIPLTILFSSILPGSAAGTSLSVAASESADPPTIEWRERQLPVKPERFVRTEFHDPTVVVVKFMDDADISVQGGQLRSGSQRENDALASIADLTREAEVRLGLNQSPEQLNEWRENAIRNLGRDVADLSKLINIAVPSESEALALVNRLNALEIVELAELAPLPAPPPNPPDLELSQGYLSSAPDGVNAKGVWDTYGATGAGIKLGIVEWSYNNHDDFPTITNVNGNPTGQGQANHGTATFGIVGSLSNGEYTTGISYGSPLLFSTVWTGGQYICVAIADAMALMSSGDVIVLEAQIQGPNGTDGSVHGYVPVEWHSPFYNCIETAIGNGYVIVMAAGNQGTSGVAYNLDNSMFNGGHAPFLAQNDSGSIIVGAGRPPALGDPRKRLAHTYGSRVSLQGWGRKVTTTKNTSSYTHDWSGTSSATAIVGGVAALVQSAYKAANGGTPATPAQIREALIATGSAQVVPPNTHIGPQPNALAAVQYLLGSSGPSVPPNFSVTSWLCYGQGQASWGSSGSGVTYQLQASHSSSFSSPWFQYVGTSQSTMLNVSNPTYFRVRACAGSNCSAFSSYGLLTPISGCY